MFNKVSVKVAVQVNLVLLLVIAVGTFYIIKQQGTSLETQLLERGKIESIIGAKLIGKVIEEAIDNGVFNVKEAFDTDYELIPGFEPKKYHTKYDSYLDKAILSILDEFLKDESVIYAVAADVNGYVPTHNTKYQQAITGDQEKDLVGNRTKRIFNDPIGIAAAKNQELSLQQVYSRDTGVVMWDISAPIMVKGKHWGGFRVGFSLAKTTEAINNLTLTLIMIMATILLVSLIMVFVVVNNSLKPLTYFTKIASDLAEGKIDQKIESKGKDEIAQLADVLERLRVSLKAAMDRLKRK